MTLNLFAEGFQGKQLTIHGTGDDNVHFQGIQRLLNRLIERPSSSRSWSIQTGATGSAVSASAR